MTPSELPSPDDHIFDHVSNLRRIGSASRLHLVETEVREYVATSYRGGMEVNLSELSPAEEAVAATLRGWGDELDRGEKFWLMNWNVMIRDVVVALRTGEPVLYEDDD